MKPIKIKTVVTVNPFDYCVSWYEDSDSVALLPVIKFDEDEDDKKSVSFVKVDCDLYNVNDYVSFKKKLTIDFIRQSIASLENKNAKASEKIAKSTRNTEKLEAMVTVNKDIIASYKELLTMLPDSEQLANNECKFAAIVASAFTGEYVKGVAVLPIATALANESNTAKHNKEVINTFLHSVSMVQDAYTRSYVINCNAQLYDDIKARYYKGRSVNSDGDVVRKFDKEGRTIRKEIILAVVQYMQDKKLFDANCKEDKEAK